ncbi:Xaa-pro dipeptidase [Nesidiocoris tenuis]|uniref:Xaa-Pro dipeptidase n=1 Tax=Nesidiocoris tenuis TaxID=355587 RepID=A0ABN7ACV1_9HEMI|nr:Xaa-pro dipeptidase [Nesidiocoris tenuis]
MKVSTANSLYYKASPIDDCSLDRLLEQMDKFTERKRLRGEQKPIGGGLANFADCTHSESEEKLAKRTDQSLNFEETDRKNPLYIDDVTMENLLRARADGVKEKIRLRKYKKHMKRFLRVYQILKSGGMDAEDALKLVNAPSVREAYSCGLKEATDPNSFWELARMSLPIKMETFAANRRRLFRDIAPKFTKGLIILKGGEDIFMYDSAEKHPFRQEPFFFWTFGVNEPNFWGLLDCWKGKATLLYPRGEKEDYPRRKIVEETYEIDDVGYTDQIQEMISKISPTEILILEGVNPDSGRQFPALELQCDIEVNKSILYEVMSELRVTKSSFELDLMRHANRISSLAHKLMMKRITADSYEYQAEAMFKFFVHFVGGCETLSYAPICASGRNSSDPGYSGNRRMIKCEDMIIFDMGASYYGYASCIACTVPASGIFNREQKLIYHVVLQTRTAALELIKAGIGLSEVHDNAMRALLIGLSEVGVIRGDVDDMLLAGVSTIFMPFGIGHLLGLDRFDVGGLADLENRKECKQPHLAQLRTARPLKAGMVMVLQVGCYFHLPYLRCALSDSNLKGFFVKESLETFINLGGFCVKDNIVVTYDGYEMMTDVPRTVEEIENWLSGKDDYLNIVTESQLNEQMKKDGRWFENAKTPCSYPLEEDELKDE